jgi:sulfatase maturation enzyme AslB (radical SAM superfamily)
VNGVLVVDITKNNSIKWLQVENTTRCNAWCPACARNNNGFGLVNDLVIEDLSLTRFQEVLESFPKLETIQFCATFGDVIASPLVLAHIKLAKQHVKKLQLHTHGSLRTPKWWEELAKLLTDIEHDVWFAIDGLKGVHEIYRQGTNFDKVIANATAFINAGGKATWQFIPWEHNEHQIKDCMKLSQQLGFKKFKLIKSVRTDFQGLHWKTGEPIEFRPWSQDNKFNLRDTVYKKDQVLEKDCMHLTLPSVYLNANGKISPCCEYNHQKQFDKLIDLPDIKIEINSTPNKICLHACGSKMDKS